MSQTERTPSSVDLVAKMAAPPPARPVGEDRASRARLDRLGTLQSVCAELGRAGLATKSLRFREEAAKLHDRLCEIIRTPAQDTSHALAAVDVDLDRFEIRIRDLVCDAPIAKLRATLPNSVEQSRSVVLELLDVMLVPDQDANDTSGGLSPRLSALDYVITLLCTDADAERPGIRHDPVSLTPKLRLICERAKASDDPRHADAEIDFYAAAQVESCDDDELERRKAELGEGFFAPGVLRSITTYNTSRLTKEKPTDVAAPAQLSDAIQIEVDQRLLNDGHDEASLLSDVRSKCLDASVPCVPLGGSPRSPTPDRKEGPNALRRAAKQRASQALHAPSSSIADPSSSRASNGARNRLFSIGGAAAAVISLEVMAVLLGSPSHPGRKSLSNRELSQISPYLLKGQRDGAGAGPSFVGALDDTWMELATADRQTSAIEMLAALRLRGARNIMIYDSSHRVRLQALGEGDVHLPTTDLIAQ